MKPVQQLTDHINKWIPRCACDLSIGADHIMYLHPTRGWKRVSFKRMRIAPQRRQEIKNVEV